MNVELRKTSIDKRWKTLNLPMFSLDEEDLELEFENAYITDYKQKGEYLRIVSKHLDLLTVDKRAMFIMAIEVATDIDGEISENNKQTWLTVDEFKNEHKDVLSLTYKEANDMSLEEVKVIKAIDEPFWEEQRKARETYFVNSLAERYDLSSNIKQQLAETIDDQGYDYEETEEIVKKLKANR